MKIKFLSVLLFIALFSVNCTPISKIITGFGNWQIQGRRRSMEDAHQILIPFEPEENKTKEEIEEPNRAFAAIYDGHGGKLVADYCANNLHKKINIKDQPDKDLISACLKIDDELKGHEDAFNNMGSCAIISYIENDNLYIANLGDSRAIICSNDKAIELSQDHKPDRPDEKERIEKAGGSVNFWGVYRVNCLLAVSRAFGDFSVKSYGVTACPEITQHKITVADQFLILACDGIFEVMDSNQAVDIVLKSLSENSKLDNKAQLAATALGCAAFDQGSSDNLSVIVILFNNF